MILSRFLNSKWRLTDKSPMGVYLWRWNGVCRAGYFLTAVHAIGKNPPQALANLEKKRDHLGLSNDEITWRQCHRAIAAVVIIIGLVLVLQTMASVYPKYVLNALQRNRADHLHMLNRMSDGKRNEYLNRLCRTTMYLRYGSEKTSHIVPNSEICDSLPSAVE